MRLTALLGIAAVLLASTAPSDPIGQVVAQYDTDPFWMNGLFPVIKLPADASNEQVVAKAFAVRGFSGKGKDYRIMNKRQVQIDGVPYMAVLIRIGHQGGVVLLNMKARVGGRGSCPWRRTRCRKRRSLELQ
jgi:hypothetical protein